MQIPVSEDNPKRARRVLQVDAGTILDAGLSRLLKGEACVELWTVTYIDDAGFRRDVEKIQPEVILLNKAGLLNYRRALKALCGVPARPAVRIVVVNIQNNKVDVYDLHNWKQFASKHVIILHWDDLAALVRNAPDI